MDVTPKEINEKQFRDAWRGYNQEEVDDFLDKVAEAVDNTQRENQALRARNLELEQALSTTREAEEMLKKTLVTAQRAAEEAISKAKAKAKQLVDEAEKRASGANEEARRIIEEAESNAKRKTLDIERMSQNRRQELDAAIARLSAYQSELQAKLKTFLEEQQRSLDALIETEPPSASGPPANGGPPAAPRRAMRPQRHDITGDDPTGTTRIVQVEADNGNGGGLEADASSSRRGVRGFFSREEG
ncbi:MAG: DivIVA domain-containing protein [Actinomycetota bacterium]|nr:DivIVA domain-containing protein [Actinomycetota bacterium]